MYHIFEYIKKVEGLFIEADLPKLEYLISAILTRTFESSFNPDYNGASV